MRVLRGTGIESEAELPFAGLQLMLTTVMPLAEALPAPQLRALRGALGLGPAEPGDRFLVGLAVLTLFSELADGPGLLCLVDDVQWLDRSSTDALLFAARRLDREGVVMLFAARGTGSSGLRELRLEGLGPQAATDLLDERSGALPAGAREDILAAAGGNPLALLELPVPGATFRHGPIALTRHIEQAFGHQVRALPHPTRALLLVAAAADTDELALVLKAAATFGSDLADLRPAEACGLVSAAGPTVTFRHPLVRAAVYGGATVSDRMAAHSALALALPAESQGDRRAWHSAAAAHGPDARIAQDLEQNAARAAARSGFAAAAAAYERAAQLSVDGQDADRRYTLACEAAAMSSEPERALRLSEQVRKRTGDEELRARLDYVRAGVEFALGRPGQAHELITAAASSIAAAHPDLAAWLFMEAVHSAWLLPSDRGFLAASLDRLDGLGLAADDQLMWPIWLLRWATAGAVGRDTAGYPPLAEAVSRSRAIAGAAVGPRGLIGVTACALMAGADAAAAEVATDQVAECRRQGMVSPVSAGLGQKCIAETLAGRHRDALMSGTEAVQIARDTKEPYWVTYASGALACLAAVEGDEDRCRRHANDAMAWPGQESTAAGAMWARGALALLDLGHGRIGDAFRRLEELADGPARHQNAAIRSAPDHVEVAIRLGERGRATARLGEFAAWAARARQPWIDALVARCGALTATDEAADALYARSLDLHNADDRPFDRARTQLAYGEWLRRDRRKTDASAQLRSALETFEALGCVPWTARTRAELAAAGGRPGRPGPRGALAVLTPQELQIVQLAARGMSNRDIAAQLFLSPRTVSHHLYRAYPKLGIASRGELATVDGLTASTDAGTDSPAAGDP